MTRLITFGCSLTHGEGVESWEAWPSLLAEYNRFKLVNCGEPGASAKRIWWNIVNFDLQPSDVVVILWTHMDRWSIIKKDDLTDWDIYPETRKKYLNNTNFTPNNRDKLMHIWYEHIHDEWDMTQQYYLHVEHANLWLTHRCNRVYNLRTNSKRSTHFSTVDFLNSDIERIRSRHPKGSDNHHPGASAHREFAESVWQEMRNK